MGSTRATRRAGIHAANRATISSTRVTLANVIGSVALIRRERKRNEGYGGGQVAARGIDVMASVPLRKGVTVLDARPVGKTTMTLRGSSKLQICVA